MINSEILIVAWRVLIFGQNFPPFTIVETKMKTTIFTKLAILAGAGFAYVGIAAQAATINLTGAGYATYGDANSYSLPFNGLEVIHRMARRLLFQIF